MNAPDQSQLVRLGQLIDIALDVAPGERRAALARECGHDTALIDKVCAILANLDRDDSFLESPAVLSLDPSHEGARSDSSDAAAAPKLSAAAWPEPLTRVAGRSRELRTRHTDSGFFRRHRTRLPATAFAAILIAVVVIGVSWYRTREPISQTLDSPFASESKLRDRPERTAVPNAGSGTVERRRPEVDAALRRVELGRQLLQRGAPADAEVSLREAMSMLTIAGDEASLDAAEARLLLADALGRSSRLVEAAREQRAALHVYRLYFKDDDPRIAKVLTSLADLLMKSGRRVEADSVRSKALSAVLTR